MLAVPSTYRAEAIPASVRDAFMSGESASYLLAQEDAYIWGTTVTRWNDGKYHAYSARWPRAKGFPAWLTDCTIVHSVADRPEGPYRITGTVLESRNRTGWDLVNAHNPYNERFLMIMKGDAIGKQNWHRIQLVGTAESAAGPFQFQSEPVYAERQTEDACIWYNQNDGDYNMVCHVMGQPDLAWFKSKDGLNWRPAPQPVFMKKEIRLDDGTVRKPQRFERPFVLTDRQGEPMMLFIAIFDQGRTGNIAMPLSRAP